MVYSPEKQMRGKKRSMDARVKSMMVVTSKNTQRQSRLVRDANAEFERRENLMRQLQDIRSSGTSSAAMTSRGTVKSKFLATINAKIMNDRL